jgi:RNA polymerase sigma factor (TIGR02999 family)
MDALIPIVYEELRRLAHHYMRGERVGHTLQTTALVNEAYMGLVNIERIEWRSRGHFFAMAATVMRRVLVDHARERGRDKRGGGLGLTIEETAEALGISPATVKRDWTWARAWLYQRLSLT